MKKLLMILTIASIGTSVYATTRVSRHTLKDTCNQVHDDGQVHYYYVNNLGTVPCVQCRWCYSFVNPTGSSKPYFGHEFSHPAKERCFCRGHFLSRLKCQYDHQCCIKCNKCGEFISKSIKNPTKVHK